MRVKLRTFLTATFVAVIGLVAVAQVAGSSTTKDASPGPSLATSKDRPPLVDERFGRCRGFVFARAGAFEFKFRCTPKNRKNVPAQIAMTAFDSAEAGSPFTGASTVKAGPRFSRELICSFWNSRISCDLPTDTSVIRGKKGDFRFTGMVQKPDGFCGFKFIVGVSAYGEGLMSRSFSSQLSNRVACDKA